MDRTKTVTLTVGALALGAVAYAVYFDYKRRNDASFRRKLRKEKKRVDKAVAEHKASQPAPGTVSVDKATLKEALQMLRQETDKPTNPQEMEKYFMKAIGQGEALAAQGPEYYLEAALSFYRGLNVYPTPVELINIYQKTVPEPVFNIVMDLINLDVEFINQDFYTHFPPKSSNVSIEEKTAASTHSKRRLITASKPIRKGDVIFTEFPIVTSLDADIRTTGIYCSQCLRKIPPGFKKVEQQYVLPSVFCSQTCATTYEPSTKILFGDLLATQPVPIPTESHVTAQKNFVNFLETVDAKEGEGKSNRTLLSAKYLARQLDEQISTYMAAMGQPLPKKSVEDYTRSEGQGVMDHLEKMRYYNRDPVPGEQESFVSIIKTFGFGENSEVSSELTGFSTILGKMAYNAIGVYFDQGRMDKPAPTGRPEQLERTRIPVGTALQVGSAVYSVSSYFTHSCSPNAKMTFPKNTAQIHIVALEDIEQGDEITVAYVDIEQHSNESATECRQRRRAELARGWKLACACPRCVEEAGDKETIPKDESISEVGTSPVQAALQAVLSGAVPPPTIPGLP